MVRNIALALAAVLVLAAAAQAQLKGTNEFRGIKFGSDISELKQMSKTGDNGSLRFYKKYGDDRNFQGVPMENIVYVFGMDGKFCAVSLMAKGVSSFEKLKAYFDSAYGPARQPEKNVKNFSWDSGDVTIELNYNESQKMSEAHYIYRPLMKRAVKQ